MEALRIYKRLTTDTIQLPIHKSMIGKQAEIIILIQNDNSQGEQEVFPPMTRRKPGSARGLLQIAADFEAPLDEEMLKEFYQ